MKIFIAYAREDESLAEEIQLTLGVNHDVFFAPHSIVPAENVHDRIRKEIQRADLIIFLVSRFSTKERKYTHSELSFITPRQKLLPVEIDTVPDESLPARARLLARFKPEGNVPAEVAAKVAELALERRKRLWVFVGQLAIAAVLALALAFVVRSVFFPNARPRTSETEIVSAPPTPSCPTTPVALSVEQEIITPFGNVSFYVPDIDTKDMHAPFELYVLKSPKTSGRLVREKFNPAMEGVIFNRRLAYPTREIGGVRDEEGRVRYDVYLDTIIPGDEKLSLTIVCSAVK